MFINGFQKEQVEEIVSIIKKRENACILAFYGLSINRLLRSIENKTLLENYFSDKELKKHIFLYYDCSFGEDLFLEVLEASLSRYSDKQGVLKQIYDLVERDFNITLILNEYKFKYKKISDYSNLIGEVDKQRTTLMTVMFPGEYYSQNLIRFNRSTVISHNLIHFPFLTEEESEKWLKIEARKLNIALNKNEINKIVKFSGGITTFIRNCLRRYQKYKNVDQVLKSDELANIVNIFWNIMEPKENMVLKKIVQRADLSKVKNYINYFKAFNLIDKQNRVVGKWIDLIQVPKKDLKIILKGKSLYFNNINLNKELSEEELAVLKKLLLSKDKFISKEEAISIKTKNYTLEYTDWAVDKFVSRLKTKLSTFGLSDDFIKNVWGKGYSLS